MGKIGRCGFVGVPHVFRLSCLLGAPLFAVVLTASAPAGDKTKLAAIPTGSAKQEVEVGDTRLEVFTYKPKGYKNGPLLLVFHGAERNASDYRDAAKALADRHGALVIAPLFDAKRFPGRLYMRGGLLTKHDKVEPREKWTWQYVPKLVHQVRQREGRPDMPYYLLGHSGGGQFLERMAGFMHTDAQRIVVANPGTHLFASKAFPYPYGFDQLPEKLSDHAALKRYLAQPLTIYLGTADTLKVAPLDMSELANKQGAFRYERGLHAYREAERLAKEKKWAFHWRLVEAKGVGHDGTAMLANPNCDVALFGKKGGAPKR